MKLLWLILASVSLLVCLIVPIMFFRGSMEMGVYHAIFLIASIGWFLFATLYSAGGEKEEGVV